MKITSRPRKLHSGHFAFMRALVEGLDEKTAWERYVRLEGEHSDARKVKTTIAWIRDEFAAAARREAKPGTARLVLIDTALIKDDVVRPTLEEFAAATGMEDFSEAEQAEAYRDAFGGLSRRGSRRAQLVKRQIAALRWLEKLVAKAPQLSDPVGVWLTPKLAERIESAGMPTLFALIERINGIGARWWVGIPAVGSLKASRIVEWLQRYQSDIGMPLGAHVSKPRMQLADAELAAVVAPATALVPLEKFVVPHELDGSEGAFRADARLCLLSAKNDYEAIMAWLGSKKPGADGNESPTQRSYRKEAERLLLWAVLERKKALSSLTVEDAQAFVKFLADPPKSWHGSRYHQRWSTNWRPLEGPLSSAALRQSLIIVRGLYSFLKEQNYVVGNPFKAVPLPKEASRALGSRRTLTFQQWKFVRGQLGQDLENAATRRRDRAIRWLYASGLRLAELVDARCGHLRRIQFSDAEGKASSGLLLDVTGKGEKTRRVPVPQTLLEELSAELAIHGSHPDPLHPENSAVPILAKFQRGATALPTAWSHSGLYKAVRRFMGQCADRADEADAIAIRKATTHWLRHTHASHALNGEPGRPEMRVPLVVVKNNLGHASLATTSLYLATEEEAQIQAMGQFWAKEIPPAR